ncbi:DNA polymerase I [Anaerococcus sp. mt242]|uniref:DNA polymerase I n=1 Tax=Anaerococcus sp. mt242 TaxID=2661917 RepID=UPI001932D8E7|nr:DNA polymerase I [Anaerococcus sp. mt242]MBM0045919.1 DNA polymerase I [Anaerococcus sp. mt242]
MSKTLMLIDGSSLIFRAFFALPNLTNNDGVMTNGVYGFLTMYQNAFDKYNPDSVLVAFDRSSKTFRHEEFKDYKATRDKMPSELSYQFGILKDILDSMKVAYTDLDGFEADDIVGTYADMGQDAGYEVVIITGDRDYLQLVDEHITVYLTKKGISDMVEYNLSTIKEEYGLTPQQLIDVKGLQGDKSDNIPGVDGIGPKKAVGYIQKYGSIEGLYEHIDEISGKKTKQTLIDSESIAYMSKKIGTIVKNAPVEIALSDLQLTDPDYPTLKEKFSKYNFNKFLEKIEGHVDLADTDREFEFTETDDYTDLIDDIKKNKEFAFKSLYNGENYIHSVIYKLAIKTANSKAYIIKADENFITNFKEIFADKTIIKNSFDIKEDVVLLDKLGIDLALPYNDAMLMHYLIDPSRSSYDVKTLSQTYSDFEVINEVDLIGKGAKTKKYEDIDQDELNSYMASVLYTIENSKEKLEEELKSYKMYDLYQDIEIKLSKVLASMEIAGFVTDINVLEKLKAEIDEVLKGLTSEIYELAGSEFNINSTKQLGEVLFKDLALPVIKKTKTGFSTDASVLEKLRDEHLIIPKIEQYREMYKLRSTYIEGLESAIDEDGRIRSTFRQSIASTGRLSSTEPNLQNLPIRTEEGRKIRKAFKASPGKVLIDADYSQIELRILASLSEDENMIDAFINGVDIHTKTASEVFNRPLDEVSKVERYNAKAVNFGIIYGISDYGLSQNLNIPRPVAKDYIEGFFEGYPNVKKYMDNIIKQAREDGFTDTLFNRRRYIPEITSKNFNVRSFGERVALNTPIQGTAADIIKIAMIKTDENLKKANLDAQIILQIHDEIILESSIEDKEKAMEILRESMESATNLKVPLLVEIDTGESMYESK